MSRAARVFWLVVLYLALAGVALHWRGVRFPTVSLPAPGGEMVQLSRRLEEQPDDVAAYVRRGELWLESENFPAARDDFRAAVVRGTREPSVLNNLAWSMAQMGEFRAALPYAENAVEGERQACSLDTLGYIYAGLGRRDRAVELYREALLLEPDNPEIRSHLEQVQP